MMLRVGAYHSNITPPLDMPHAGWGAQTHIYADGHDGELVVGAMYVTDGTREAILIDYDLCVIDQPDVRKIRSVVAESLGLQVEAVVVCTTHNHAGAQIEYNYYGIGGSARDAYVASIVEHGIGAALEAKRRARPARFGFGKGACTFAVNRRQRLPGGRVVTGADPEGVTDTEVQVFRFDDLNGAPIAGIFTYTAHPTTLGPANRLVSADYPGVAKRVFASITGAVPLFLQGAAGNVGPGPDGFTADLEVHRRNGTMLAAEAAKVFLSIDTRPGRLVYDRTVESGAPLGYFRRESGEEQEITIDAMTYEILLPVQPHISVEEAQALSARAAERLKALREQQAGDEAIAAATFEAKRAAMRLGRCSEYYGYGQKPVEAHLLRIGEAVFAGVPLEPFVETGLEVKRRSVFPQTFFGGYTNGAIAYIPTAESFPEGGYEVDTTPYTPEAAAIATEGILQAIADMQRRKKQMDGGQTR